jgi:hypothetical protein
MSNELLKSINMDWSNNWNIKKGENLWAFPTYVSFKDSIYVVICDEKYLSSMMLELGHIFISPYKE